MSAPAPEIPTILLEPNENAPALARDFLAGLFREWGSADDYMARLVVSELVTNAWRHGEGKIILRVFRDVRPDLAVIEVWDQGDGLPVVGQEDFEATSGRGLLLVSQLVHSWGTRPIAEGGKIVWAKCAL
ncbi:Histidine kinase-like ATPase domain-containing protein [Actinomadura meyerae]|uniref:Histidine kinase-like ATPase domain-containing protein n=1 Tax=Actinomadura meyerae TaxID=240840 RepID=A0A239N1S2_9ACTN|nr:ATP-binding protein [Actinomadura meyerae]SNT48392.1 Histidine kinase-like ATPase domain-containing protein [Actinomadura meyerae]